MEKSRAIELLEHLAWDKDNEGNCYGEALNMAIEALKAQLSQEGTTSDLISRQWLLDCINDGWIKFDTDKDANRFIHLVRDIAPTIQPERAEGEWVQIQRCARDAQPDLECPFCKYRIGWWDMGRYCAGCGAKLKGGAG